MDNQVIAKRLKQLRGKVPQQTVARAIGIRQSTYAMYETGRRVPGDENKRRLAQYHGKTVQEIFFDPESH